MYVCFLLYRRQAFWIAKQLLQLGMGDAFDDWLIEKIQLLRRGVVIASAIKRIEQVREAFIILNISIAVHFKKKHCGLLSITSDLLWQCFKYPTIFSPCVHMHYYYGEL